MILAMMVCVVEYKVRHILCKLLHATHQHVGVFNIKGHKSSNVECFSDISCLSLEHFHLYHFCLVEKSNKVQIAKKIIFLDSNF